MAQANIFLEEDEVDENSLLLDFYEGNREFLRHFPLHRIPDRLKFEIAALFFRSSRPHENEWIGVLEDLGVDYITIDGLDFKSSKTGVLPIYLALNGILKNTKSFGDIIDVLRRREKFHILLRLKPFVEGLLSKHDSLNEERPRPSAPDISILSVTSSLANLCGFEGNGSAHHDTEYDSVACQQIHKTGNKALENFQNSKAITIVNKKRLSAISNFQISQSNNELISVFIMHSMLDKKYAKKLAACLKEKNFRVITSANIYYYLRENPMMVMKLVNEKVDYVIPVITESFMKQITPTRYFTTEEKDIESVANTFMYDCLLNEYTNNFRNRRVRPVCYSLESKKLEIHDQILSWACYLPYSYLQNGQCLEFFKLLRRPKKRINI